MASSMCVRNSASTYWLMYRQLALPLLSFSEPIAPAKLKYNTVEWNLWDRFKIEEDLTLQGLIDWFQEKHSLELTMLSSGCVIDASLSK